MKLYQQLDVFLLHYMYKMATYMEYYVQITIFIRKKSFKSFINQEIIISQVF